MIATSRLLSPGSFCAPCTTHSDTQHTARACKYKAHRPCGMLFDARVQVPFPQPQPPFYYHVAAQAHSAGPSVPQTSPVVLKTMIGVRVVLRCVQHRAVLFYHPASRGDEHSHSYNAALARCSCCTPPCCSSLHRVFIAPCVHCGIVVSTKKPGVYYAHVIVMPFIFNKGDIGFKDFLLPVPHLHTTVRVMLYISMLGVPCR
jgi:hypothetical protein